MVLGVERIGDYKITDMGNGQYAVALTNGNMGAFVTDKKGLLEFKKKHNLETDTVEFSNKTKKDPKCVDSMRELSEEERMAIIKKILDKKGKIDPRKDKVYYNPVTGELDTWKPGIYDPEKQEENRSKIRKLLGGVLGVATIGLGGLIFRKPIGSLVGKAASVLKTAGEFVFKNAQGIIGKVIKFFGKKSI